MELKKQQDANATKTSHIFIKTSILSLSSKWERQNISKTKPFKKSSVSSPELTAIELTKWILMKKRKKI